MNRAELEFALSNTSSTDWRYFEILASQFVAAELPEYRNMAATYGDKGRDGESYCIGSKPTTLFQISVTADWESKIRATVKRLKDNFPKIRELVYLSNQEIGPAADDLKKKLREEDAIFLDVRDASWFADRFLTDAQRESASSDFVDAVASPLLSSNKLSARFGRAVSEQDARIGLLHLALDATDKGQGKGLTKASFDSLVLSVLHDTDSKNRITAEVVTARVLAMLPTRFDEQASIYVKSALARLARKNGKVKYWTGTDDYCLSYAEIKSLRARASELMLEEGEVEREICEKLSLYVESLKSDHKKRHQVAVSLKQALEECLLQRGEQFAAQVATGEPHRIDSDSLKRIMMQIRPQGLLLADYDSAVDAICSFVGDANTSTLQHLRRLGDAYTLFAFLRQTPDVQKAIVGVFSDGDIWLDTSAILPLLTESLCSEGSAKHYTNILGAARDVGIRLYVTSGVIQEVVFHLNRALACSRTHGASWRSRIPFVFSEYIKSGRSRADFASWIEDFRGNFRPEDDVAEMLESDFGVKKRDLGDEVDSAQSELRIAATEYWYQIHERRRNGNQAQSGIDPLTVKKLVDHDVECSVGVIYLRGMTANAPMGYRQWWLCLDHGSIGLTSYLRSHVPGWKGTTPAIDPDFLSDYLRISPLRAAVSDERRISLPVLTEMAKQLSVSTELIGLADRVRAEHSGLSERLIRRKVRDALDEARALSPLSTHYSLGDSDAEILEGNAG